MKKSSQINLTISPQVYIMAAAMVLLLPAGFLLAAFVASVVHECCHLMALRICHVPVYRIEIQPCGARIVTGQATLLQDAVCALAGPAGSFLCLLLIRNFPMIALCAFVQGLYNLLPVYPLDGGRILRCIFTVLLPHSADRLCAVSGYCIAAVIISASLWLSFRTKDPLILLFSAYFMLRTVLPRKTPCKAAADWVQYS